MIRILPFYITSGIIGIAAVYAGLTDKRILFISNPRAAVIVLTITGFLMCSLGSKGAFIAGAPLHPLTLAGYVLGALALFAGIAQIFGLKIPYLSDPRNALIIITAVIIIKFVIARLSFLLPVK